MNYEIYQELQEQVNKEDFYTKYKGLMNWLYRLSWVGNLFCIVFAYFHVNHAVLMALVNPSTTVTILVAAVAIGILFALEGLKRVIFGKLMKSWIEQRMKWVGTELNVLVVFAVLLVAASFYLSLAGAQEYADRKESVATQMDTDVTVYQDSLTAKYDRKTGVLESRNTKLFDETRLLSEQGRNETPATSKRMLKEVATNNVLIAKNEESIKQLKQEREAELTAFEQKQKSKGSETIKQGDSNIVRFVSFSTVAEILILLGVAFRGYFPYRSKVEFDKIISSEPKYRQFELYNQLLNVLYRSGVRVGDALITKAEMTKVLQISGVDLYGKQLDDTMRVLRHLKIIQKRGAKNVVKVGLPTARELVKEYLSIK